MIYVLLQSGFQVPLYIMCEMSVVALGKENNEYRKINTLKCLNIVMKNQEVEFFQKIFISGLDPQIFLQTMAICSSSQDTNVKKESWRVISKLFSVDSDRFIETLLILLKV